MGLSPGIAAALMAGDMVVTSTARAARALRRLHADMQRTMGFQAWSSADVLPWEGWLDRLWQQRLRSGNESRMLLTPLQEQQVWVRIVSPEITGKHLISESSVADLAQQAYALLATHQARDFLRGDLHAGEDVEKFRTWARRFEQECRSESWLSRSLLPAALADAVNSRQLPPTGQLMLAGFDRILPDQQALIDAVRAQGQTIAIVAPDDTPSPEPASLVEAADMEDEVATCALWVRHQLTAAGGQARIAVIVPDVAVRRPQIDRIFREVLTPESAYLGAPGKPLPFEFSLGVALAQLPMVRAALLLLRWMDRGLLHDEGSWLMLSGLICISEAEQLALARYDVKARQQSMRPPELDLAGYLEALNKNTRETAPLGGFRRRLVAARRFLPGNATLSFAQWVQRAGRVLDVVRWPGPALEGEDFQVLARWSQLLDAVAALAFDGRTVPYNEFLSVLEYQARQTIYSAESHDAPVQILGPLEAAGLRFDGLWFLGADDQKWPAVGRPHPFLTRTVQRQHVMPHASSEADWKLAQQATNRLVGSAQACVLSYASLKADGTSARPSALAAEGRSRLTAAALRQAIGVNEELAAAHDLPRTVTGTEQATILPWPEQQVAGGAEVLRDQAACPFRAFAQRRLGARSLDPADWGMDPRARGSLVHAVLDKVWATLLDRDGLVQAQQEGRLPGIVARHLDEAMQQFRIEGEGQGWNTAYLAAEHERWRTILEDWLGIEAKRADFAVEAREQKREADVGGLKLQLRVDRIDRIAGGRVVIDYKTGKVDPNAWDGSRIEEPQLPIYAGFTGIEDLAGVLFAQVAEDKSDFKGRVIDQAAVFPTRLALVRPPYSPEMLMEWKGHLLALAQQFLAGEAQVDPKQYPTTCQYCDLPGLCRIADSQQVAPAVVDVEPDEE